MGVDTWNDVPDVSGGWKPDEGGVATSGWEPDFSGADNGFTGDFSEHNISKHADGEFGGPADGGCRICGKDGHFARDCPQKMENSGLCYNCNEPGHNKADCPNERVEREFTGECRVCGTVGHRAAECPEAPARRCKVCGEEGHVAAACTANRLHANFASLGISEVPIELAWEMVAKADDDKDVEDIKKAILTYARAFPELTYPELEASFRDNKMNTYLIAKKQDVSDTHTIVNLQGQIDQAYIVSIQFSAKPRRHKFAEGWPESMEENMSRLAEAGIPLDRMVPKCNNCGQMGHGSKQCPEEKVEKAKPVITCVNCNGNHYVRDCPEPRKSGKKGCRICSEDDHIAKDCPNREERVMTCRNCGGEGHKASDCDRCRNCLEEGHTSRECPKPTDWSRVTCRNCGEKGHGAKRCPQPPKDVEEEVREGTEAGSGGGDWGDGNAGSNAGGGGWGAEAATSVQGSTGGW